MQFTTPNFTNASGAVTNRLGQTTFINHGLVGIGRISASTLDSFGETFGSISGLQVTGWTNHGNGRYSGIFNILPDRGYNHAAFFSDYAARIQQVGFIFVPCEGSTNLGGSTDAGKMAAQNQIRFTTPVSGVKFTYDDPFTHSNSITTGLDPGTNFATLFGHTLPYVRSFTGLHSPDATVTNTYPGINKLPIDAEALVLKPDGSGYLGDEYGPNIYRFDSSRKITGTIVPPAALRPDSPAHVPDFTSTAPPVNGRRNNQGFEGVALSPDGARLFALLQSATVQDGAPALNDQNSRHTRLLVYDVSTNPTNDAPAAEYALTLPPHQVNGNGAPVNRTCAQSEILALDQHRLLVLSRDNSGLGSPATNQNVYKSVLLVDTRVGGPTNFVNQVTRNIEGGRITTAPGVLDDAIKPLEWVEAINLLNTNQLARFNIQIDTGTNQVSKLTMSEKWEGLALVSVNDISRPDDFFLFIGNDNDFLTSVGQMRGPDGTVIGYNAFNGYPDCRVPAPMGSTNNENDTQILAYRVTIVTSKAGSR